MQRANEQLWLCIDPDSSQHVFQHTKTCFSLIEMALINPDTKEFEVYAGEVDVDAYAKKAPAALLSILDAYGYEGIAYVQRKYPDNPEMVIAECIFEYWGSTRFHQIFTGSKAACCAFIQRYIKGVDQS